jgi:hypothetical protein
MGSEEEQILYDSPKAAEYKTVTGWVASTGHFLGDDEHMARYIGSTHKKCECGNIIPKNSYCSPCYAKRQREEWLKMPIVEWDGECMLAVHDGDQYFSELEEFYEFCRDNDLAPDEVMLVITEPEYLSEVTSEFWQDELPEDGELPSVIADKLDELNKAIEAYKKPICWRHGKKRVIITTPADWPKDDE